MNLVLHASTSESTATKKSTQKKAEAKKSCLGTESALLTLNNAAFGVDKAAHTRGVAR